MNWGYLLLVNLNTASSSIEAHFPVTFQIFDQAHVLAHYQLYLLSEFKLFLPAKST